MKRKSVIVGILSALILMVVYLFAAHILVVIQNKVYYTGTKRLEIHVHGLRLNDNDAAKLQYFNDVEYLRIFPVSFDDISFLREMPELKYAFLGGVPGNVKDFTPLESCTKLEEFHGWTMGITDLGVFADCTELKVLDLTENNIESVNGISHLTNLRDLTLYSDKISSIDALKELEQPESLTMQCPLVPQEEFSTVVGGFSRLQYLNLAGCSLLTDISFVNNIPGISELNICNTNVTDISPLAENRTLKCVRTDIEIPDIMTEKFSDAGIQVGAA